MKDLRTRFEALGCVCKSLTDNSFEAQPGSLRTQKQINDVVKEQAECYQDLVRLEEAKLSAAKSSKTLLDIPSERNRMTFGLPVYPHIVLTPAGTWADLECALCNGNSVGPLGRRSCSSKYLKGLHGFTSHIQHVHSNPVTVRIQALHSS
ncbi:uncharacterized protein BDZ99DRAFT_519965 [Mytilinidion resinicola]|uniref:Uncharacterized protein n=1 Tax=Mytilinidion resinicola TaxID=574789 RepID=A0A6A6YPS0_9PEZI|nr:uncharacterized protein BDZ99DRAFT_519965 [Mytilinidion resinicola]KAF2809867.1 hypothetical protein BDZ99DRAFT_519965 [Mytilinidion resinicola]